MGGRQSVPHNHPFVQEILIEPLLLRARGFKDDYDQVLSWEERAEVKGNNKRVEVPVEVSALSNQALNLSELRFIALSNEGTARGMISRHQASLKIYDSKPSLPTQAPRLLGN